MRCAHERHGSALRDAAADELFGEIAELGVRDGANLEVAGYDFAPTFSIWPTIEECLNPPVIWERGLVDGRVRLAVGVRGAHARLSQAHRG